MTRQLLLWLKVSRPGLWFQTVWLFLLPTAGHTELWSEAGFWIGLAWVALPLNLLVYGWNDLVDWEIDRDNPRKDSWLFGARASRAQLATVPLGIALANLPFAALFWWRGGFRLVGLLAAVVAVSAAYNLPRSGLRGRPPLELLNQLGYLLVLPISSTLCGVPPVSALAVLYLVLFCTHAHLIGEIMDVGPDRRSDRRTTATVLGEWATRVLVLALMLAESVLLQVGFGETVLAGFLAGGAGWLALDTFVLSRDRPYTRSEFTLFGIGLNLAGFASIGWLWWRGGLS